MGRPASSDRKEVVTLRLRQSVISAYKADGEDWRARMETAIEAGLEKPAKAAKPTAPAKPAKAVSGRKTGPAVVSATGATRVFTMDDVRPPPKPGSRLKPDKPKR